MRQRTLAKLVSATGVGLHSGERVILTLHPAKENEGIMNEAKGKAFASLEYHLQNNKGDWNALKNGLRNDMRKHIFNKTKRSPMILPILMEG